MGRLFNNIKGLFVATNEEVSTPGGFLGRVEAFANVMGTGLFDGIRGVMGGIKAHAQVLGSTNLVEAVKTRSSFGNNKIAPTFG